MAAKNVQNIKIKSFYSFVSLIVYIDNIRIITKWRNDLEKLILISNMYVYKMRTVLSKVNKV